MDVLSQAFADADRSFMAASKAVGSSVPRSLVGGMPSIGAFSSSLSKASEQYQHYSGWAYVAVRAIASRIAGQSVCVGRVGTARKPGRKLTLPQSFKSIDELIEPLASHPFLTAVAAPNPLQTQWSLIYSSVASMLLTGRSCWWLVEENGELQIWPIPSHWIEPADRMRSGWKLRPPGLGQAFDVPATDIIPFILPDPSNPLGLGVSPLQSQAMAVATDEEIQKSQFAAFQNGVFPSLAFKIGTLPGMAPGQPGDKPILTAEQRIELVSAVKRLYTGGSKAGEPLILDGLIESVDKISNLPEEMDYLDSGLQTKNRILQAYGVNPVVAGQLEGANRASSFVASMHFAESTCNPLIEQISQTLTRFACQRFSTPTQKLVAWVEPVKPNDSEMRLNEWKAALAAGVVSPNEFRQAVLNIDAMAGGDVVRDALGNPMQSG
ncbi:phage portal protein [Lacipirellula limnantheis]|uniref:Phage portal protein n=1 Tax=Lacipirellula limnantheis TaxID=2528024 RepID=A0A517TV09_9BACT|nr:phage portal protein [Lacipirellula limnantheis]QDT72211.1 Phage portal protein [Lacipirellula limnantheis]